MADDEAKVLADAKRLPLADRLEHKLWKVRSEAFEDIRGACNRAFSNSDPILNESGPLFAKGVGDANANVMDKALDALCAWLQKADESQAARLAGGVCSTIPGKCLKARPVTASKAVDACLLLVELEQSGEVVEGLVKALGDKVPKVPLAALDVLCRAVAGFGAKVVDPKPLVKALPAVFTHPNAGVREKVKELTVELAACTGPGLVEATLLDKMGDAMKKDVGAAIAALPSRKKQPERFTRREAAARAAAAAQGDGAEEVAEVEGPAAPAAAAAADVDMDADPYDFADPVDILGQLAKTPVTVGDDSVAFWDCFTSSKWNVRRAALDRVRELARAPRLCPGDYGDLVREMKKVLAKDANINCAAVAADAAGALAGGLRRDFASQARQLCPSILERFKEKNTIMSKAADQALRTMAKHCYALPDVIEELTAALAHKNPKVRLDTLRLLRDMVEATPRPQLGKNREPLLPAVAKLAPEADPAIREAAQGVLVAAALKLGSYSAIQPYLSKLEEQRAKLIEEAVGAAAAAGAAPAAAGRPASAAPAGKAPAAAKAAPTRPGSGATAAAAVPKALAPKARSGPAPGKQAAARPAAEEDDAALAAPRLSSEEVEQHMSQLFGAATVEQLRSVQWQERLEAMGAVAEGAGSSAATCDCPALVQCLAQLPGWSEKNFQVLNKVFELMTLLAREGPGFGRREAGVAVEGLGDKIHELKHRLQVCEALTAMSEVVGPRFVAGALHRRAAANKNPKVLAEALTWLAQAVEDFGLAALDLGAIIQWTTADLGSPTAPVRNQAMAVLGKCHVQVGGGLMAQLADSLKPAQVTALEEMFRKHPQDGGYKPTRAVRSRRGRPATAGADADAGGVAPMDVDDEEEGVSLEDLLPRTNISGALSPALLGRMGSANWKERSAALDEVETAVREAGGRITPDLPPELFTCLRARMTDTNRNLAAKALLLIGKLAEATGPPFDRVARPALGPALANLSDNKKQVRDAVIVMLDAWGATCPAERLFPAVADAVANPKVVADGRVAGLGWMGKALQEGRGERCAPAALRAATVAAQDKAGAVREAGNALMTELAKSAPPEEMQAAMQGMDPSLRAAAEPAVQKALAAAGAATAAAIASSRAAPAAVVAATAAPAAAAAGRPSSSSEPSGEAAPLLLMNASKGVRARAVRTRAAKFEPPAPEELEALEAGLAPVACEALQALLFSRDFRDHVKAADLLAGAVPSLLPEMKSSLELVLRWAAVRLCDGNPQALTHVLDLLRVLLQALAAQGHELSEAQAAAALPTLVEKAGHNQDRVRAVHREVLRGACALCPTPRALEYVTQGLGSKNSRTRVECCEVMVGLAEAGGAAAMVACRAKPMTPVIGLLRERDGAVRSAALSIIEAVWVRDGGDALWRLLGRVDPVDKEIIEDRLRRAARAAPRPEAPPAAAAAPAGDEQDPSATPPPAFGGQPGGEAAYPDGSYDDANGGGAAPAYARPAFTPPNALDMTPLPSRAAPASVTPPPVPSALPAGAAGAGPITSGMPTPVPRGPPPTPAHLLPSTSPEDPAFERRWGGNLVAVASPSLPQAIEALKQLCADIMLATDAAGVGGGSQHMRAVMGESAQRLFATVNRQLIAIFDAAEVEAAATGAPPSSRGCKYALNVMLQGMGVAEMARGLPQATLRDSISLLLLRLVDDKGLLQFEEGPTLVRAVNVLMVKTLEAANRNYVFAALLQLLREPPPGVGPAVVPKFNDLVVKCLIRLTKSLTNGVEGVDLSSLLFNLHDFLMFLGVDEIRKRSSSDDKPLRMVKTILHELCKMEGHGIYAHTAGIPGRDADPPPPIFGYIKVNLSSLQRSGLQPSDDAAQKKVHAEEEAKAAVAVAVAQQQDAAAAAQKAEVKQRLKDIMSRLVQRDPALQEAAMMELHRLRGDHPAYVDRYIAGTSDMFRQFISSGLDKLQSAAAAGAAPASGPGLAGRSQQQQQQPVGAADTSPSPSRLNELRERMSQLRTGSDGGAAGAMQGSDTPPAPGWSGDAGGRAPNGNGRTMEELMARMQTLRGQSRP